MASLSARLSARTANSWARWTRRGCKDSSRVSDLHSGEFFLEVMNHQRLNNRVQVAFQNERKVIECQLDAMIGHAVLREIIGADALVAFARPDLAFANCCILRIFLS